MKYSELAKIRAKQLYDEGVLTHDEYAGVGNDNYNPELFNPALHVCWFSICIDERNQLYICEECAHPKPKE